MIWRRNVLTPATFLIIMMRVFTGHTLTCHPAEYQIGNDCCPKCAAGSRVRTDCSEFRSTSCLPCLDGTYMDEPTGMKRCFSCTNCDEGRGVKVKTSCTTASDAVCEPLEGFYCIDPIRNHCAAAQKHRICYPGQYIKQTGTASTDTVCSDCSTGTFSDGTFTSCHPHTHCQSINLQLIKPGTDSADAECGEKRSNVAAAVINTCVLILLFSLIFVGLVYFRNKKSSLQQAERNRNSSDFQTESGLESSEPLRIITTPPD